MKIKIKKSQYLQQIRYKIGSKSAQKNFGDIHIDVKNAEEAESGVISPKKSLKNSQKIVLLRHVGNPGI